MEDTQVNKTHRNTDIQTGRDPTLSPTYSVCVMTKTTNKNKIATEKKKPDRVGFHIDSLPPEKQFA